MGANQKLEKKMKKIKLESPYTGEVRREVLYLWANYKRTGYGQWTVYLTFEYKNSKKTVSFWTNDEDVISEMTDESAWERYGERSLDSVLEWVYDN